ncbi:two-component response regulator-like APRR7 isoform X2 [Prosopis cineraria]|uniref:two-component response regulator-like APRR7 isoform X2 n=1 Tax=Prosopis cineraria TaxID=364024 RepID=UPI002410650C|nr:two-component response regulator-like APRR7 isoform X2 [Prosopis cineraria]
MGLIHINDIEDFVIPKRLAELSQHMQNDQQKIRGGVTWEGQDLSIEDESRINDNLGDENDRQMEILEIHNHINQVDLAKKSTKQLIQGPLVRWVRFLPVRSLKVLLVENDDSTRHVVCALLRNCGYEVEAVANGQQAWIILEDLTTNIDLVLTEVILPCLSGISLLSKIMNHKMRKNIPVIVMSSHDSMSVVFKCLSRGAVDFLVKPLRKNELKILWQHVWRKCHSSSGSGSESGVRTQKSLKSESGEHSSNEHGNCDEDDIGSIALNARDRSDNGSGTQNSWTKLAVEVDSPRLMSPREKLGDPSSGSAGAQVVHSVPAKTTTKDCETQDALGMIIDINLEITAPRSIPTLMQPLGQREVPSNNDACNYNINESSEKEKVDHDKEERQQVDQQNSTEERLVGEYKNQVIIGPTGVDLVSNINSNSDPILEIQCLENPNGMISNEEDKNIYGNHRTLNGATADVGSSVQDQHVLKPSHRSAFSRYNSASHQAPAGNVGSCSPIDNSSEAAKTVESVQGMQTYFNNMPRNTLYSNGSNNNYDMGSATNNNDFTKPPATIEFMQASSTSQPTQNVALQPSPQENGDQQHIQVQHHHHYHHHHHHHHMHNMVAHHQAEANQNGQSLQLKTAMSLNESSTNPLMSSAPVKSNNNDAANLSLNGSASGSHHGSNMDMGNNNNNATLLHGRSAGNMEHDHDNNRIISEKEGTISLMRFDQTAPNVTIQNRFERREAALNKFRQKRKERCFEKRVRYQSRKKLAEQRPRVRGQFARHAVDENNKGK